MVKKGILLAAATLLLPSLSNAVHPARELYAVQLAAFPTEQQAKTFSGEAVARGWAPVVVKRSESDTGLPYKVQFGRFDTQADAEWWKLGLRKRDYNDAFIVSELNWKRAAALPTSGPMVQNFRKIAMFTPGQLTLNLIKAKAGPDQEGLEFLLSEKPERLNANSTATQRLMSHLRPVADGQLPASKIDACRARLGIANAEHYARFRLLTSYQAYGEALELAEPGSAEEAECLLQRAAVLKELSDAKKCTKDSARRACLIVLEKVSTTNERAHAVATLMFAETFVDQGAFDLALPHLFSIAQKWPNRRREIAAAQVYAGIACAKLRRYQEAKDLLQKVMDMNLTPADCFMWNGKYNLTNYDAAKWLAHVCERMGQQSLSNQWKQEVLAIEEQYGDMLFKRHQEVLQND